MNRTAVTARRRPAVSPLSVGYETPPMNGIVCRPLQRDDFDRGFLQTLAALTKVDLNADQARAIFDSMPPNQFTFVADHEGRVVGTTSLFVDQKYIHSGGRVGHIEDVSVAKEYQRRGIGTELVRCAVAAAQVQGCYKVILHCFAELSPFYQRMGFRDFNIGMRHDLPATA